MKKYQYLLFDIDGTILDFNQAELKALNTVFLSHHIDLTEDILDMYHIINTELWDQFSIGVIDKQTIFDKRFVKLFENLGIELDGIAFDKEYQHHLCYGYDTIPYAKEVLEILHEHYQLYVVTNGTSKTARNRLKGSQLEQYFHDIFISEEIGYQKPDIRFFNYCFSHIPSIDLNKTMIIGDNLFVDIQGGINAKIDTCYYGSQQSNIIPTYHITDLRDLLKVLGGEENE